VVFWSTSSGVGANVSSRRSRDDGCGIIPKANQRIVFGEVGDSATSRRRPVCGLRDGKTPLTVSLNSVFAAFRGGSLCAGRFRLLRHTQRIRVRRSDSRKRRPRQRPARLPSTVTAMTEPENDRDRGRVAATAFRGPAQGRGRCQPGAHHQGICGPFSPVRRAATLARYGRPSASRGRRPSADPESEVRPKVRLSQPEVRLNVPTLGSDP